MTRDQAFALAREIDDMPNWRFFSVEPRPDGRYQVKAIFGAGNGEIFHSREDFLDCPYHKIPLTDLARPSGNEIAKIAGGERNGRH